jgi:hypothetical protein
MFRAALGLLLTLAVSQPCFAEDEEALEKLRAEVEKLRQAFDAYKAAGNAEIERLNQTLAEQTERATRALARARQVETELNNLRARLELARRRTHDLQESAAALAEEVRRANATNEKNRAWLENMSKQTSEATAAFKAARKHFATIERRHRTEYLVRSHLPNAIEHYRDRFHRVPPMSVKELNVTSRFKGLRVETNTTNECNEALLVALRNPDFPARLRARFLPTKEPFGNTDSDVWSAVPDGGSKLDAVEIVDAWGHPIVYIHKNQYNEAVRIVNGKGVEVQVVALVGPDGVFYNPTSYQIFSLGPNGVQEVETKGLKDSDDIRNFELKGK